jgi:hypothetical protein
LLEGCGRASNEIAERRACDSPLRLLEDGIVKSSEVPSFR